MAITGGAVRLTLCDVMANTLVALPERLAELVAVERVISSADSVGTTCRRMEGLVEALLGGCVAAVRLLTTSIGILASLTDVVPLANDVTSYMAAPPFPGVTYDSRCAILDKPPPVTRRYRRHQFSNFESLAPKPVNYKW